MTTAKISYRARMRTRRKDSSSLLPVEYKDALESNVIAFTKKMLMPAHMVGNHFNLTKKYMAKEESELRKRRP